MTNNTIHNVPRELLDSLLTVIESNGYAADEVEVVDELRAILSAPSPAGVAGLEAVGYVSQDDIKWQGDCTLRLKPYSDYTIPLCRLSDAQAIIDGLREDRDIHQRACIRAMEDRNQLAKCLKFARTTMSVVADNANLRGVEHRSLIAEVNRIDAALSAGKEPKQCT